MNTGINTGSNTALSRRTASILDLNTGMYAVFKEIR